MAEKLTIVVTCTDRKSARAEPDLMVRNLMDGSIAERVDLWKDRLEAAEHRVPLRELYRGESWTQAMRLEATARAAGFAPRMVVASAGLGLVDVTESAPPYAATFSPRQDDSVGTNTTQTRQWWNSLTSNAASATAVLDAPSLLVLSKSYADAMCDDLEELAGRDDVVVFGGSEAVPSDLRVAADRGLRTALGGTTTSLNLRTAIAWIERLPTPRVSGNRDHAAWTSWASAATRAVVYDRQSVTDTQVRDFVLEARRTDPTLSKTRALRLLRDAGHACEQRRFGELFQSATEAG